MVVAPGFVDAHTHMDAQVFWDDLGKPTCWHGVTSVVMGNCGFTLAPARDDARALVVRNLERAEDIAPEAMAEGITWTWSTFAEFLDAVDALPKGLNYAAAIGHSALRTWAMGERAFEETADEDDLAAMALELRVRAACGRGGVHDLAQPRSRHLRRSPGRVTASLVGRGGGVGRDPRPREQRRVPAGARALVRPRRAPRLRSASRPAGDLERRAHRVRAASRRSLPQPSLELMDETRRARRRPVRAHALPRGRVGAVVPDPSRVRLPSGMAGGPPASLPRAAGIAPRSRRTAPARPRRPPRRLRPDLRTGSRAPQVRDDDHPARSPYLPNPTVADEARRRGVDPSKR